MDFGVKYTSREVYIILYIIITHILVDIFFVFVYNAKKCFDIINFILIGCNTEFNQIESN